MRFRNPKLEVKIRKFLSGYVTMCSKATEAPDYSDVLIDPSLKPKSDRAYKILAKMHSEVSILESPGFNNACYLPDVQKWVSELVTAGFDEDQVIDAIASQFRVDPLIFKRNLSNDMIFIDPVFKDAFTLAHELGHYICTRKSPKSTYKLWHSWYENSMKFSEGLNKLGDITLGFGIVSGILLKSMVGVSLLGISAVSQSASALTGQIVVNAESAANEVAEDLIKRTGVFIDSDLEDFHRVRKAALSTYIYTLRSKPLKTAIASSLLTGASILISSNKARTSIANGISKLPTYIAHIKDEAGNLIENITH